MKSLAKASVLLVGAVLIAAAQGKSGNSRVGSEIRALLLAQQEAWNRGDIDGFMNGYARGESTVFVSGDEVTRGWQTVRNRYLNKYGDRGKMGTLTFSDLEIEQLAGDCAIALGRWQVKRATDNPHGRFTLIFRRTPDGWRIVHDHTSAAAP
ncbi:MAG TPA: nuclear transport factor 2 family protein [Chthoniobacterales bacterium]